MKRLLAILALLGCLAPFGQAFAQIPPPVPPLPDAERRAQFSISATTCVCSLGFPLFGSGTDVDSWIEVWVAGVRYLSTDPLHGWALTSATGTLATIPRPITNAVLTFTAVQTGVVQIVGAERPRRLTQFPSQNRDLNVAFSDLVAQNRETWDKTNDLSGRTLQGPPGDTVASMMLAPAATRAGQFFTFDAFGAPSLTSPGIGLGNVLGPASSVNNHVAVFSGTTGKLIADGGSIGSTTLTGDVTGSGTVTFATTLATVNANVGSFGSATQCLQVTANGKGLITAASVVTCTPAFSSLTGQATLGQLPSIANNSILANNSGGAAVPSALSPSAVLDMIGSTQGMILYRDAAGWLSLAPGGSGQLLASGGAAANPSWVTASGTGTVTAVGSDGSINTSIAANAPITATGTLSLYGDPGSITNCILQGTVAGNALTVAFKSQSGNNPSAAIPCLVSFRNATAATGDYTYVKVTAATSFVTAATGDTFGSSNSTAFRLWITAWNNAGTVVLGVSKQSTPTRIFPLNESAVQSSTACSACGTAASSGVFYTTAAQTSKAIRIIGYMDWSAGLATAGVWASGPTTIQMYGPGVNKPGSVVQSLSNLAPAQFNTSSNTFQTTNLSVAISPTAAPNLIRIAMTGYLQTAVSSHLVQAAMFRGATQLSAITKADVGATGVSVLITGAAMTLYDAPGTTASTTYAEKIVSDGVNFGFTGTGDSLIVDEIMGANDNQPGIPALPAAA